MLQRASAADDGDRVLEPQLGDRQVLGQVGAVDVPDLAQDGGRGQDVGQLFECLEEVLLCGDQRIVRDVTV